MKNTILIIIVLVLIGGGAYIYLNQETLGEPFLYQEKLIDWKQYDNGELYFSYPSIFEILDEDDEIVLKDLASVEKPELIISQNISDSDLVDVTKKYNVRITSNGELVLDSIEKVKKFRETQMIHSNLGSYDIVFRYNRGDVDYENVFVDILESINLLK